ncbi:cytochrome P-450, putative [Pediculus humanus corporis]|uniref:Cytochrome P-450, putative n=1 Tax=Pediculus humanus subsp. corporis TaxID=121224 RepID=E0VUR1_PEDHC|nr:cytochrome P-450, putative [Pediculus humanus corporis]EEB17117.1 cytochrome P-450, putative [Pediculus humanus corporis]
MISDVDDVKMILCNENDQKKGILYDNLKPWLGTGLLTSSGKKWKIMRKIITSAFHFSILRQYLEIFSKNSTVMMYNLSRCDIKKFFHLNNFITYCALDSIYETSMGTCINSQINKTESDYVKAIFRIGQIIVKRIFSPHLYADYLFNLSSLGRENSKLLKILHETTTNIIQERKKKMALENQRESFEINGGGERKMNFLNLLLEKQKIYKFSDVDIRYEVDTILMAGHDTTSTALNWCFFELGLNKKIQNKVHEELKNIFGDSNREPTYEDIIKMEYLKRVILETLRLYPSVPVISRKFDVDIRLKNYTIPANTEIVLMIFIIHRNSNIFPKPDKFDPDRFKLDVLKKRNPFAFIPFSAGSRNCLGQKYAMLQMLVLSSYILRKYKIKTINSRKTVKPVPDVILRPNVELKWKLIPKT